MDLPVANGIDQLDVLMDQTFTLWRATPLVYFTSKTCDGMMENLRAHLADSLVMALNTENSASRPEVSTVMGAKLEALNVQDWESVDRSSQILELAISIWRKDRKLPSIYKVYFLPATLDRGSKMIHAKDYPLLLMKIGNKKIAESVKQWIQKEFSCHITQFHVSGITLSALVNWWTSTLINKDLTEIAKETKYCLELTYQITFSEDLSSLTFNISLDQIQKMQNLIQDTELTMMELIQEHVYKTMRIKMDHCVLSQVGTPIAYISNTSQMKLLANVGRVQYLEFLSELCDLAGTTI